MSASMTATEVVAIKVLHCAEAVPKTSTSVLKEVVENFSGLEANSSLSITSRFITKLGRTVHAHASRASWDTFYPGKPGAVRRKSQPYPSERHRQHDKYWQSRDYETKGYQLRSTWSILLSNSSAEGHREDLLGFAGRE